MTTNRRDFLKLSGLALGLSIIDTTVYGISKRLIASTKSHKSTMKLSFKPYDLMLKHVFTVASNSRISTPVVLTQIEFDGHIGYGEASMPPYLGESHESVLKFLQKIDLSKFNNPFELEDILTYVDGVDTKNTAAKASIDIALHDLVGKLQGQPLHRIWGLNMHNLSLIHI